MSPHSVEGEVSAKRSYESVFCLFKKSIISNEKQKTVEQRKGMAALNHNHIVKTEVHYDPRGRLDDFGQLGG